MAILEYIQDLNQKWAHLISQLQKQITFHLVKNLWMTTG